MRGFNIAGSSGDSNSVSATTDPVFTLSFAANGAMGAVPAPIVTPAGGTPTLPDEGALTKAGHDFNGWRDNHGAVSYAAGETFIMPAQDVTLAAQWTFTLIGFGEALLVDFGSGAAYNGTNSPAHAEGSVPETNTSWVKRANDGIGDPWYTTITSPLGVGDSLRYSTARAGTESSSDGLNTNFGSSHDVTTATAAAGAGVWGTALTTSYIVDITSAHRRDPIAVALGNLKPGDYYVYAVAHRAGNLAVPLELGHAVLAGSPTGGVAFGTMTGVTTLTPDADTSMWTSGADYVRWTVTITNTLDTVIVMVNNPNNSGTGINNQATLSSLQIVSLAGEPEPSYSVTYDAGGGTGTPPVDGNRYAPANTITVMGQGNVTRTGYTFLGWRDEEAGVTFEPLGTFAMPERDVTLVAQWEQSSTDAFSDWLAANDITGGATDLTNGVPNLIRYALGGNASTPLGQLQPELHSEAGHDGLTLSLTFHRIDDPQVTYAVWYSEDLVDWGGVPVWEATGAHNGTPGLFDVEVPTNSNRGFLRLTISRD